MEFLDRTLFTLNAEVVTVLRLLWAALAFTLVMVIAHIGSGLLRRRLFARGHGNPPTEKSLLRVCRTLAALAGLLVALRIVGFGLTGLLLFCGLLALALAVVARGVLANYVAGIVLLYERPVAVGDHIQVGSEAGEVEAIRLRVTHVRTPGNTRIIVPNSLLMRAAITNFSAPDGRVRLCIGVQVAHGSDANDVIMTLRKVAERNPRVRKNPAPRSLMTGVVPDGLQFELWAWIGDPADTPWVENELYRGIDSEFQKLRIRLSGPDAASPPSGRRPARDEFVPAARMQTEPTPPEPTARPAATDETARLRTPRVSNRRPRAEENTQARENRQVRQTGPADRVPPTPEAPVAEPEAERAAQPKRGRTRSRATREPEVSVPSDANPDEREEHDEEPPSDAAFAEFTLLEQPELAFESAAKEEPPVQPKIEGPESMPEKASVAPEVAPPTAPQEAPNATEKTGPEPAPKPSFGRSKRKASRR